MVDYTIAAVNYINRARGISPSQPDVSLIGCSENCLYVSPRRGRGISDEQTLDQAY